MKTTKLLLLGALALLTLAGTGCVTKIDKSYAEFVSKLPAATITDVSTDTKSPLWSFHAGASGISTDPKTGLMTITNGTANLDIPLWGFTKQFKVSGLQFQASPEQLAAAAALQKAAAEAVAKPPTTTQNTPRFYPPETLNFREAFPQGRITTEVRSVPMSANDLLRVPTATIVDAVNFAR